MVDILYILVYWVVIGRNIIVKIMENSIVEIMNIVIFIGDRDVVVFGRLKINKMMKKVVESRSRVW